MFYVLIVLIINKYKNNVQKTILCETSVAYIYLSHTHGREEEQISLHLVCVLACILPFEFALFLFFFVPPKIVTLWPSHPKNRRWLNFTQKQTPDIESLHCLWKSKILKSLQTQGFCFPAFKDNIII
jgi:hypothetical protein